MCSFSVVGNLCRFFYCLFISLLSLEIQLSRGEGWDPRNRFNPATFLSLFQTRNWISNAICHDLFLWSMCFRGALIGGIVDHDCLNIFLHNYWNLNNQINNWVIASIQVDFNGQYLLHKSFCHIYQQWERRESFCCINRRDIFHITFIGEGKGRDVFFFFYYFKFIWEGKGVYLVTFTWGWKGKIILSYSQDIVCPIHR